MARELPYLLLCFPVGVLIRPKQDEWVHGSHEPKDESMEMHHKAEYGQEQDFLLVLDHFCVRNGELEQCGVMAYSTQMKKKVWIWTQPLRTQFLRVDP